MTLRRLDDDWYTWFGIRRRPKETFLEADCLARLVFDTMSDKQVVDVVILDLRPVSTICDFFVLGTAGTERQLRAAAEAVTETVSRQGNEKPLAIDGEPASGWVIIDYGDVVVHLFDPGRRRYYALEAMWSEAPLVARMP